MQKQQEVIILDRVDIKMGKMLHVQKKIIICTQ